VVKNFNEMWALFGGAFVDIEFHLKAALAKTLIRALHLLGQHLCFSAHELQDGSLGCSGVICDWK
jgi:hypothetical protein